MLVNTGLHNLLAWGVVAGALTPIAAAQPPMADIGLLPGDSGLVTASNSQTDLFVCPGGGGFLALWTDARARSSGSQTIQSDFDVFGIRLDGSGHPVGAPFLVAGGMGYQRRPKAAWNGENWLVMFESQDPTQPPVEYWETQIRFTRVSQLGVVLDAVPMSLPPVQFEPGTIGLTISGTGGSWLIARCVYHSDGYGTFLAGQRIASSGQLLDAAPVMLMDWTYGQLDVMAVGGEYLVVGPDWNSSVQKARRISANLQPIAPAFNLPVNFVSIGASSTGYLVTWIANFTDLVGSPMSTSGVLLNPSGTLLYPSYSGESGVAHDGTNWWVLRSVSNEARLVRVSSGGTRLDAPGGALLPINVTGNVNSLYDPRIIPKPGGGVLFCWTDWREAMGTEPNGFTMEVAPTNVGQPEQCVTLGTRSQRSPSICAGADGLVASAYVSEAAGEDRVYVQLLAPGGAPVSGEPIEVGRAPVIGACGVAWNGSVFMTTWSQSGAGVPGGIVARRLNPDGTFVDAALQVMPGDMPSIAALIGNFCIAGVRAASPQIIDLWAARVDGATGARLDGSLGVRLGSGYFNAATRTRSDGVQWLVASHSQWTHDSSQGDAVLARVPASGAPGAGFNPTPVSGGSGDLDIAFSGTKYLLVWRSNSLANANNYVSGRIMNADGTYATGAFVIAEAAGRQLRPTAVWDGAHFLVAWDDQRNQEKFYDDRTQVSGVYVSEAGGVLGPAFRLDISETVSCSPALEVTGENLVLAATTRFAITGGRSSYRVGVTRIGDATCNPDANGDGNADQADVDYIINVVAGGANPTGIDPDVNRDGNVDQGDIDAQVNIIAGGPCP